MKPAPPPVACLMLPSRAACALVRTAWARSLAAATLRDWVAYRRWLAARRVDVGHSPLDEPEET